MSKLCSCALSMMISNAYSTKHTDARMIKIVDCIVFTTWRRISFINCRVEGFPLDHGVWGVRLVELSSFSHLIGSSKVICRQGKVEFLSTWKTESWSSFSSLQEASSTFSSKKMYLWILHKILCHWHWFQGKIATLKNLSFLPVKVASIYELPYRCEMTVGASSCLR